MSETSQFRMSSVEDKECLIQDVDALQNYGIVGLSFHVQLRHRHSAKYQFFS